MLARLILLFTLVPLLELMILIEVGRRIGTLPTLLIVVGTGLVGAWLARAEGFGVMRRIRSELASGVMPADAVLDGAMVLAGGLLLLTPGILTDLLGLALLIPRSRQRLKTWVARRIRERIEVAGVWPPDDEAW